MKKTTVLLVALFTITFVNSQNWGKNKIKGNGNEVTVTRNTEEYDEITTGGSFSVELVAGKEGTITMQGDENLLELIVTKVENNRLKIYIEKGTWFDSSGEKIKITIPFESISRVDFAGSGKIKTLNPINSDDIEIHLSGSGNGDFIANTTSAKIVLSGSGNLTVTGTTTSTEAILTGSGGLDCSNLVSEKADALLSGSGDLDVNCTKELTAKISGSGNIVYSGNPETVDKKVTGSGNITKN